MYSEKHRPLSIARICFGGIAWRLQAEAEGDLSERARRRASELANDSDLRLRAPRSFWREIERNGDSPNRDPRLPATGTALERVYQGQILRVTVLANGFEYHGKNYASLSAIAHRVTGTRWNVEETPDKTWSKFFPSVEWEKRNTYAYPLPYTDEFCHLYAERFALKARPGALCRV